MPRLGRGRREEVGSGSSFDSSGDGVFREVYVLGGGCVSNGVFGRCREGIIAPWQLLYRRNNENCQRLPHAAGNRSRVSPVAVMSVCGHPQKETLWTEQWSRR